MRRDRRDHREDPRFQERARNRLLGCVLGSIVTRPEAEKTRLRARGNTARDPVPADFHFSNLRIGVARTEEFVDAPEDFRILHASAHNDLADGQVGGRGREGLPAGADDDGRIVADAVADEASFECE